MTPVCLQHAYAELTKRFNILKHNRARCCNNPIPFLKRACN